MEDPQHPQTEGEELVPRSPSVEDLLKLCSHLNDLGANYVVIGGFAIRGAGYPRETHDIDFVIATDLENEAKVYAALATLPDQAVLELQPGEVSQYTVVRVNDEITVDLMASASGIDYEEAAKDIVIREINGVPIPFASPRLLYRMKETTHREKDRADLLFLRTHYAEEIFGKEP
ncbi:MAG: nucleotidyltransferase [Luteolibacter sp.]